MTSQSHYWRLNSRSEIPKLDCTVSWCWSDEVLIFIEVTREDFVLMSVYFFDIFSSSDIPYSQCLITTTRPEDAFMSGMPDSLINNEVMHESAFTSTWACDVPKFYWSRRKIISFNGLLIVWRTKYFLLIDMIPLTSKYFTLMLLEYFDRDIVCNVEEFETAVTSSTENLVGISLIEAHVVCAIRCLPLSQQAHVCIIHLGYSLLK